MHINVANMAKIGWFICGPIYIFTNFSEDFSQTPTGHSFQSPKFIYLFLI